MVNLLAEFPKLATRVGCLSCLVTSGLDKLSFLMTKPSLQAS